MQTSFQKELTRLLVWAAKDPVLLEDLLEDLLTPQEFEEIATRWQLVQLLDESMPQREIAKKLGVSISKITRGSRELLNPKGGFRRALDRYKKT
jgi:TrpR family trp operon transcriptional repressor